MNYTPRASQYISYTTRPSQYAKSIKLDAKSITIHQEHQANAKSIQISPTLEELHPEN
jgi:hypothetical protein